MVNESSMLITTVMIGVRLEDRRDDQEYTSLDNYSSIFIFLTSIIVIKVIRSPIKPHYTHISTQQNTSINMLNINQKYICAYNEKTYLHYIANIDLLGYTLALPSSCDWQGQSKKMGNESSGTLGSVMRRRGVQGAQKQLEDERYHGERLSRLWKQGINDKSHHYVDFKHIFVKFSIDIDQCLNKQLYLPQLNKYCRFQQLSSIPNCLPLQLFDLAIIIIKFIYIQADTNQNNNNNNSNNCIDGSYVNWKQDILQNMIKLNYCNNNNNSSNNSKYEGQGQYKLEFDQAKQRDRSRSIGQIMQFVRKWRFIADQGINGKKFNLQQAAVYVGIPKKSLDDYFYQLRVGEKFDFDFQANLDQNISILRKFVKQKLPRRNKKPSKNTSNNPEHESQQNSNNKQQQQVEFKLPKKLKQPSFLKPTTTQQSPLIIIPKSPDNQSNMLGLGRLSDSDVSSLNMWPNANKAHKDEHNIFDDQDSFFNDFKLDYDDFVGYQHLIKGEQGHQQQPNYQ